MTYLVIILFISLLWFNFVTNRIPKRGRIDVSDGETITAAIINTNRVPDHAATLRAKSGETIYKVKIKASESHLWIKGDEIKILISKSNKKNYRILFNDYFKENEERIRAYAIELLEKKAKYNSIGAKAVKYTSGDFEKIKNSKFNSNQIFYFSYIFNSIDRYTILAILLAILILGLHFVKNMALKKLLVPIILLAVIIYYICTAVKICTDSLAKASK
ncbi:MAG: hypothetical protein IKA17_10850 [Clostridia bacterium]|nr:hypothetical protein [Clostridia bacterium]